MTRTDYEVRGLTSGDWPLFGSFFYIAVVVGLNVPVAQSDRL
jgi:hypothetical protein